MREQLLTAAVIVPVAAFLIVMVAVVIRKVRSDGRQHLANVDAAHQHGLRPAQGIPAPWLTLLPDHGQGHVKQAYVGRRGSRSVTVAEYRYSAATEMGPQWLTLAVAVVGLRSPRPRHSGAGRSGPWHVAGTDLLAHRDGRLEIPGIFAVVDELLEVAAWFEPG
jgi:hypothetical protein